MQDATVLPCAASGIPVLVEPDGETAEAGGGMRKTIAPASVSAIGALMDHPSADWAKAAAISLAEKRRVWYAWTSDEGTPDTEFDWHHGMRLSSGRVEVGLGEESASAEGQIDQVLYEGVPGAKVTREDTADEQVMQLYERFKQEFQKTSA